jgi:hypothetical protein
MSIRVRLSVASRLPLPQQWNRPANATAVPIHSPQAAGVIRRRRRAERDNCCQQARLVGGAVDAHGRPSVRAVGAVRRMIEPDDGVGRPSVVTAVY